MYMCTRYYSPEIMRFLSADVLTGDVKNTQSLNRYAYCQGNPISFTDPFGMSPEVRAQKAKERADEKRQAVSLRVHNVLDAGGMIPAAGAFCDGANGMLYLIEGDLEGVAFSAIAFIPVIGQVSTPAKYLDDAAELTFKYGDDAAEILWNADDAYVLAMKYGDDFSWVSNTKSQRWLDAEAKLKKSTSGDIGSTIDSATGYEVGTIYVDPNGNAMISPKGGGFTSGGYRGLDTQTIYPNGSAYQRNNPNGHINCPGVNHGHGHLQGTGPGKKGTGLSIDVNGNVVPYNSPDAHWKTYP